MNQDLLLSNGCIVINGMCLLKLKHAKIGHVLAKFYLHRRDTIASSEFNTRTKKRQDDEIYFPDDFKIPVCLEKYYGKKDEDQNFSDLLGLRPVISVNPVEKKKKDTRSKKDFPYVEIIVSHKKRFGGEEEIGTIKIEEFEEIFKKFGKITKQFEMEKTKETFQFDVEYFSKEKEELKRKEELRESSEQLERIEKLRKCFFKVSEKELKNVFVYLEMMDIWPLRIICKKWCNIIDNFEEYYKDYTQAPEVIEKLRNVLLKPFRNFKSVKGVKMGLGKLSAGFTKLVEAVLLGKKFQPFSVFRFNDQHFVVEFPEDFYVMKIKLKSCLRITVQDEFPVGNKIVDFKTKKDKEESLVYSYEDFESPNPFSTLYFRFTNPNNSRRINNFEISIYGYSRKVIEEIEASPILHFLASPTNAVAVIPLISMMFKRSKTIPLELKAIKEGEWYYKTKLKLTKELWKNIFEQFKDVDEKRVNEILDTIEYFYHSNKESFKEAGGQNELFRVFDEYALKDNNEKFRTKTFQRFVSTYSTNNTKSIHLLNILKKMTVAKGDKKLRKTAEDRIVFCLGKLEVDKEEVLTTCLPMIVDSTSNESVIQCLQNVEALKLNLSEIIDSGVIELYINVVSDIAHKKRALGDHVYKEVIIKLCNIYGKCKNKSECVKEILKQYEKFGEAVYIVFHAILTKDKKLIELIIENSKDKKYFTSLIAVLGGDFLISVLPQENDVVVEILGKYLDGKMVFEKGQEKAKECSLKVLLKLNVKYFLKKDKVRLEKVKEYIKILLTKEKDVLKPVDFMNEIISEIYAK